MVLFHLCEEVRDLPTKLKPCSSCRFSVAWKDLGDNVDEMLSIRRPGKIFLVNLRVDLNVSLNRLAFRTTESNPCRGLYFVHVGFSAHACVCVKPQVCVFEGFPPRPWADGHTEAPPQALAKEQQDEHPMLYSCTVTLTSGRTISSRMSACMYKTERGSNST